MRILSATATNFGSYKEISFDFTEQGLTLIQGPTGSGKSTLCDLIPWVLFGVTAKGGPVNEVLSWPGNSITTGEVTVELDKFTYIVISRKRGPKSKDNDLYYSLFNPNYDHNGIIPNLRGKDIPDTQRLINQRLGITADLYLAGAYYHEFSQTAQFFTTNAKNRRAICEQIVDLSMPKSLQEKAKLKEKSLSKEAAEVTNKLHMLQTKIDTLNRLEKEESQRFATWQKNQEIKISNLEAKNKNFENDRKNAIASILAKIRELDYIQIDTDFEEKEEHVKSALKSLGDAKCPTCGGKLKSDDRVLLTEELHSIQMARAKNSANADKLARLLDLLEGQEKAINTFEDQLILIRSEVNPHSNTSEGLAVDIGSLKFQLDEAQAKINKLTTEIQDIELLQEVIADFRTVLIKHTIVCLEHTTNELLAKHFDAEIRVEFTAGDADKLEVSITKDGNQASFTQLSKGQRQLLKLCFGTAIMKQIQNQHQIEFSQVFYDEALDGLDDNMKAKAFDLFSSLEEHYESVFLVEHSSEMKTRFSNQYMVSCINGGSKIEKAG